MPLRFSERAILSLSNSGLLLFILCVALVRPAHGVETIAYLPGANDWASAARLVNSERATPMDTVIEISSRAIWLHVALSPDSPRILHLANPTLREYQIISLETGESLYTGGLYAEPETRVVFHPNFVLPLRTSWGNEFLMRIEAVPGYGVPIQFLTTNQVTRFTALQFIGDGMYYGAISLMIVFAACVALFSKDPHSFRLCVTLLMWLLTMGTISGYGNLLIWPDRPETIEFAYPFFGALAGLSSAWFSWHFLRRSAEGSFFLVCIKACMPLCGLLMLSAPWLGAMADIAVVICIVATGAFVLSAAAVSATRGDSASRYLMMAALLLASPYLLVPLFPELQYFPFLPGTGALVFVVVAVMKRVGEHIQKQEVEAEVVASRARFLASMSHEIRTPLNGVIGFSQLCSQEDIKGDASEYLAQIQRSSQLLLNVVNEVLDFSKLEAGGADVVLEAMPVRETLENITTTLMPAAKTNEVELVVDVDSSVAPYVVTDPARCSQILVNLLGNAIKFANQGTVTLTVRQHYGCLEFVVQDNGIGIEPSAIETLFDPYRQATTGTSRQFGGTGLGLSIAKQFAELLGGAILVSSEVGKGSIFTLQIPYEEAKKPRKEENRIKVRQDLQGVSVLVAEDNLVNQLLVKKILEKAGVQVESAENGQIAMDRAVATDFDVILMDVQMPRVTGVEAAAWLREQGCETPIVALTANNSESDKSACLNAGMNDFLSKPYAQDDLINKIEHWSGTEGAMH